MPVNTKPVSSRVNGKPGKAMGKPMPRGKVEGAKSLNGASAKSNVAKRSAAKSNAARPDLDIEHFRSLLLSERARLEEELEQIRSRNLDVDGGLPDEGGEGGDEDTADLAAAMMDKEMDLSVEDEIQDLLGAIDHAMQKIDDGTYGICDISGEPIPESRLELIPWASLTVTCQALSEGE